MHDAIRSALGIATITLIQIGSAQATAATDNDVAAASADNQALAGLPFEEVVVKARRRDELARDVPIPLSAFSGETLESKGIFNIIRLTELQPSLQMFTSNPRNTAVNIRGLGAPFGLTNDGIEPGVGVYVDQVYHARPASTTFDFVDVEQLEILRGPQGTLYGKNTTSGAINVTTRAPEFESGGKLEVSYGDLGFQQARGYLTGPLGERSAARLSFSGTQRDGVIRNTLTNSRQNDLDNLGVRGQLLYQANENWEITLLADYNEQRATCCTQVFAGVAPTQRPAARQFPAMAAELDYAPPSTNPFDRLTDIDTPLQAHQDLGGVGMIHEWDTGRGLLTSVTAWRYWNWYPSNDRDFTALPITTVSANPSKQRQFTQELRFSSTLGSNVDYVVGLFLYQQKIDSVGAQEQGSAAARWLLAPAAPGTPANSPELLDGLRQENDIRFKNRSYALFGQLTWQLMDRLRLLPGLRLNYDDKDTNFNSVVSGGLQTDDPVLIGRKNSILQSQTYTAASDDSDVSGQLTLAYELTDTVNAFASYSRSFKSVGVNLSGIPNDAQGNPAIAAATVKPEKVNHYEAGLKSSLAGGRVTANVNAFQTTINDYQANVVNSAVGVLRGYLANAGEVRVRGVELELNARIGDSLSLYASGTWSDGKYTDFVDAPCPLELAGAPGGGVCDISGQRLPGLSDVALSIGGEFNRAGSLLSAPGEFFAGIDASYRSNFSSSATPSEFLVVDAYSLTNVRLGFRAGDRWEAFFWARNIFDKNYFEFLSAQPGSSGMYVGQVGDPRTAGLTLSLAF